MSNRRIAVCTATRHDPTPSGYSWWGCRCDPARQAWVTYNRNRRHGHTVSPYTDAQPTANRIRVLVALGYDWRTLAHHLGATSTWRARQLAKAQRRRVTHTTAEQVKTIFAHLVSLPAPCGYAAGRALDNAMRAGWGVADRVAVDMALAGCSVHLTDLEKHAVIHIGHARGLPNNVLADAAHLSYTATRERLHGTTPRKEHQTA